MSNYKIFVGIDTGTQTGFAIWHKEYRKLHQVTTLLIHQAMQEVLRLHGIYGDSLLVRFEDARQVRYKTEAVKAQGAGSVKRDCSIWSDFLTDHKINFEAVRPKKAITKWDAAKFKLYTGWTASANQHGRDSAMLVFGA